jgi:hypothetical protein
MRRQKLCLARGARLLAETCRCRLHRIHAAFFGEAEVARLNRLIGTGRERLIVELTLALLDSSCGNDKRTATGVASVNGVRCAAVFTFEDFAVAHAR